MSDHDATDRPADVPAPGTDPPVRVSLGLGDLVSPYDPSLTEPPGPSHPVETADLPGSAGPEGAPALVEPADRPALVEPADRPHLVEPADRPHPAVPADPPASVEPADSRVPARRAVPVDRPGGLRAALEAVLMVVETPVPARELAGVLGESPAAVTRTLRELAAEYRGAGGAPVRGFELRRVAGGWRMYSAPEQADVVAHFLREGAGARLTRAALETLAVVAYRQPISRGRISAIRGVNVDSVVRTLVTRGLIEEAGQDGDSGAVLFRTTTEFLERMGFDSIDDLEPLAPFLPEGEDLAEIQEQTER